MASAESPSSVIVRFAGILDAAGIPYMLTGSFASGIHGQPRASHDIDFVIAPTLGSLNKLLEGLPPDDYYVSREAALDAYGRESLFNVVDMAYVPRARTGQANLKHHRSGPGPRPVQVKAPTARLPMTTREPLLSALPARQPDV